MGRRPPRPGGHIGTTPCTESAQNTVHSVQKMRKTTMLSCLARQFSAVWRLPLSTQVFR
jgi:hypothetical protein